tara:strand:- start:4442 stop:4981 length:540 start_codon:yes stop_codon:yes gene_type:complete
MKKASPCFSLGYIESAGIFSGAFILRPEKPIPSTSTDLGFCFGHSVLEMGICPVFHFVFHFYDHGTFNGLVHLRSSLARRILQTMIKKQDYFFVSINPNRTITAFRSTHEGEDLVSLKTNFNCYKASPCPFEHYKNAVRIFSKNLGPRGRFLRWVCRDNADYLDFKAPRQEIIFEKLSC